MKILLITQNIDLKTRGIYQDLIEEISKRGHKLTILRGNIHFRGQELYKDNIDIHNVKIKNQFGVNNIRKGLIMLTFQRKFIRYIKKNLSHKQFDLILYATPPITFAKVITFAKKKFNAKTYLMLKDIFPQNAIDLNTLNKNGIKKLIYKYFKRKEEIIFRQSDKIGCMSKGNIDYVISNYPYISPDKVELFPNAIYPSSLKKKVRTLTNQTQFFFGGNLGHPQNIPGLLKFISKMEYYDKAHFTIVGKGTYEGLVENAAKKLSNLTFIHYLPKEEYTKLLKKADVGIISLDPRFTIPNIPSRFLSYLELEIPILATTDKSTDIKEIVIDYANCGLWNNAKDFDAFKENIIWFCENRDKRIKMGQRGRVYMENNYSVEDNVNKLEVFVQEKDRESEKNV